MTSLYCIFSAIWRRVYGEGTVTGILGNRAFQAVIYIILTTMLYFTNRSWECFFVSLAVSVWFYAQFWSRSVSCFLDCGEIKQDGSSYNRWFKYVLNIFFKEEDRYYGRYDFYYSLMRYTCCMIPMCIFSCWYLMAGISAPYIYWFFRWLYNKYPNIGKRFGVWLDAPKNPSEIVHGFVVGLIQQMVLWG